MSSNLRNVAEQALAVWFKTQEATSPEEVDFRLDFERFAGIILGSTAFRVLCAVHAEQMTHEEACDRFGVQTDRPDRYVARREAELGRELLRNHDIFTGILRSRADLVE